MAVAFVWSSVRLLVLSLLLAACRSPDPGGPPDAGYFAPPAEPTCETNDECEIRVSECGFPCRSIYAPPRPPSNECWGRPSGPLCLCVQNYCRYSHLLEGMACMPSPDQCDQGLKCCPTTSDGGTGDGGTADRCVASPNGACP